MTESVSPRNLNTVTPSLTVSPCAEAIDFYAVALGAEEVGQRMTTPDGLVAHAEIRIGDSIVMLGDEWPDGPTRSPRSLSGSTSALFIYLDDVEPAWKRAVDAGMEVVYPLELQFYGDKGGRLRDPFGHTWGLAEHVEDLDDEEMARRMAAFNADLTA
ncbi:MAG: VOC family protein [Microthrixaceae bacterium]